MSSLRHFVKHGGIMILAVVTVVYLTLATRQRSD
jgi:hypothetical protein